MRRRRRGPRSPLRKCVLILIGCGMLRFAHACHGALALRSILRGLCRDVRRIDTCTITQTTRMCYSCCRLTLSATSAKGVSPYLRSIFASDITDLSTRPLLLPDPPTFRRTLVARFVGRFYRLSVVPRSHLNGDTRHIAVVCLLFI